MSAEEVAGFKLRFANRVVHIYISGAIKLADLLKIDEFAIVVKGKELNAATDHCSSSGWRYKKLKDGTVYIASLALQELCVAEVLEKSLPFVQNLCNPRLTVSFKDGRLMATVNRQLLLRAGDVEQNPGPSFIGLGFLVACVVGFSYVQNYSEQLNHVCDSVFTVGMEYSRALGQRSFLAFDWLLGEKLDDYAYDCAVLRAENANWRSLYEGAYTHWIIRAYNALPLMPTIPRYGSVLREPTHCVILTKIWRVPVIHDQFSMASLFQYAIFAVYGCMLTFTTGCLVVWRCVTGGVRRVKVVNKQKPFVINTLKDSFRTHVNGLKFPKHQKDQHIRLAFQRRAAEEFCFNTLLEKFERVRDVGGSRSRWPDLGWAKHVCGPVVSNDDILREEKDRVLFENCRTRGEECPHRSTIPAAVISHVDYHMTIDQLTRTITGPTFIINHDFNRFNTGVGKYEDAGELKYEAAVDVNGSRVSMTPDGGTPYMNHPFHNWLSEASAVSSNGAFTYVRLGDLGETSVYYCHPSDGVYDIHDPNALTTSAYDSLPNINGFSVTMDDKKTQYRFTSRCNNVEFELPMELIDDVALTMASAPRDQKYGDTLRSYLVGKMKAKDADISRLSHAYGLSSYLSDLHAVKTVPFATCIQGHPVNFTWFDIARSKVAIMLTHFTKLWILRTVRDRIVTTSFANRIAPWMFSTVSVPTYEVYVNRSVATYGTGRRINYSRNACFQNETTAVAPSVAECGQCHTSENAGQHANISRDASVEHRTPTAPSHSAEEGERADHSTNVEFPPKRDPSIVIPKPGVGATNSRTPYNCSKTSRRSADGKSKGVPSGEWTTGNDATNQAVPVQREQCKPKQGPVLPTCTVITYSPPTGTPESIIISPSNGADQNVKLPEHIKNVLGDEDFEIEGCLLAVEEVIRAIEEQHPEGCDRKSIALWALGYYTNPAGKCSDKSAVPKGTGLLPATSLGAIPKDYGTIRFRDVGIAIPPAQTRTAENCAAKGAGEGVDEAGREGQEFLENRNKRKTGRSEKHLPKKR